MREVARTARGLAVVLAVVLVGVVGPSVAVLAETTDPPNATTADSVPLPTETPPPDTASPDSVPVTTPEATTPSVTTPSDPLVGAGDPDGDIDPAVAVFAVVGFLALLAVASWWMVRRSDPDAAPMPPDADSPPSDLI